jgi:hypothetical protein
MLFTVILCTAVRASGDTGLFCFTEKKMPTCASLCHRISEVLIDEFVSMYSATRNENRRPHLVLREFQARVTCEVNATVKSKERREVKFRRACAKIEGLRRQIEEAMRECLIASPVPIHRRPRAEEGMPTPEVLFHEIYVDCAREAWKSASMLYHGGREEERTANVAKLQVRIRNVAEENFHACVPTEELMYPDTDISSSEEEEEVGGGGEEDEEGTEEDDEEEADEEDDEEEADEEDDEEEADEEEADEEEADEEEADEEEADEEEADEEEADEEEADEEEADEEEAEADEEEADEAEKEAEADEADEAEKEAEAAEADEAEKEAEAAEADEAEKEAEADEAEKQAEKQAAEEKAATVEVIKDGQQPAEKPKRQVKPDEYVRQEFKLINL